MRTVSYQVELLSEADVYVVYELETRHATTGDEFDVHSVGPSFLSRHEASAFIRDYLMAERAS